MRSYNPQIKKKLAYHKYRFTLRLHYTIFTLFYLEKGLSVANFTVPLPNRSIDAWKRQNHLIKQSNRL